MAFTQRQIRTLAILPKASAFLSFLGSFYITSDFIRKRCRRKSAYQRLVFGMSCVDLLTSTAYFLSTWPIPSDTVPPVFLASGNARSCAAQGFTVQLGLAIPFYNASLAMYYYLVTRANDKRGDRTLRRVEPLLHAVPLSVGLSTAVAGLPLDLYHRAGSWCWIAPSPDEGEPPNNYGLYRVYMFYVPVLCCITSAVLFISLVFRAVRRQERKAARWRVTAQRLARCEDQIDTRETNSNENGERSKERKLSRRVAVQGLHYVFAFVLTWASASATRFAQFVAKSESVPYVMLVLFVVTLPAQGFFNFLVYNRGRYVNYWRRHPDKSLAGLIVRCVRGSGIQSIQFSSKIKIGYGRNDRFFDHDHDEDDGDPSHHLSLLRCSRRRREITEQFMMSAIHTESGELGVTSALVDEEAPASAVHECGIAIATTANGDDKNDGSKQSDTAHGELRRCDSAPPLLGGCGPMVDAEGVRSKALAESRQLKKGRSMETYIVGGADTTSQDNYGLGLLQASSDTTIAEDEGIKCGHDSVFVCIYQNGSWPNVAHTVTSL